MKGNEVPSKKASEVLASAESQEELPPEFDSIDQWLDDLELRLEGFEILAAHEGTMQ